MRRLFSHFERSDAFLRHYRSDGGRQELFLPGLTACAPGELCDLEVRLGQSGYRFHSLAQVLCRRQEGDGRSAGALVRLFGSPGRVHQRVQASFPVTVVHRGRRERAHAVNYSVRGVQLTGGPADLDVGDLVKLRLHPLDEWLGLGLQAQVVWVQRLPELCWGVALRASGSRLRRRLDRLHETLLSRRCRCHADGGPK